MPLSLRKVFLILRQFLCSFLAARSTLRALRILKSGDSHYYLQSVSSLYCAGLGIILKSSLWREFWNQACEESRIQPQLCRRATLFSCCCSTIMIRSFMSWYWCITENITRFKPFWIVSNELANSESVTASIPFILVDHDDSQLYELVGESHKMLCSAILVANPAWLWDSWGTK